jgi:hypothetical protein
MPERPRSDPGERIFYRSTLAFLSGSARRNQAATRAISAGMGLHVAPSDVRCLMRRLPVHGVTWLQCDALSVLDSDLLHVHVQTTVYARGIRRPRHGFRPGTELTVWDLGAGRTVDVTSKQLFLGGP